MTKIIRDERAAMEADGRRLQLALQNVQRWCEGKKKTLNAADVRRLITALIRINRGAQVHMAAVGAWATWHANKQTIVDANGQRPDGGNTEKDWAAVLWAMRLVEEWAGTPAQDIPAPETQAGEEPALQVVEGGS